MTIEMTTVAQVRPRSRARARMTALVRRWWSFPVLLALTAASFYVHAHNLGHVFIAPWDESVHAVVAEHVATHPLQPTLYEIAAVPQAKPNDWTTSHIWLHIPPLGLWSAGLSMRVLGASALALRLPDLLFSLLGIWLVFTLGRRLYGPAAGLIAAAFVGFAPYPLLMSQGWVFGDVTDIPLVTLTPLAVLGLMRGCRTGRRRWLVLGGACLGLCYLCKGALGLAPAGVAVALFVADWVLPREAGWHRLGAVGLAAFLGAAAIVALPYNLYVAHVYPADYARESGVWVSAFLHDYEGWGMPLDGHLTSWLFDLYGAALALLLVCSVAVLAVLALRRRSRADLVPVAWILTLYVPLTIAVTKSPPMTFGAFPAFGLALGRLVTAGLGSRSAGARAGTVGLLLGSAGAAIAILTGQLRQADISYATWFPYSPAFVPDTPFRLAPYAVELALSLVASVAFLGVYVALGALPRLARWLLIRRKPLPDECATLADARVRPGPLRRLARGLRAAARHDGAAQRVSAGCAVLIAAVVLGAYWFGYDMQANSVRLQSVNDPVPALGAYLERQVPANATVLMPNANGVEWDQHLDPNLGRLQLMFYAHRDVYGLTSVTPADVCRIAAETAHVGSPTVVFSDARFDGTALGHTVLGSTRGPDVWTLYLPRCP